MRKKKIFLNHAVKATEFLCFLLFIAKLIFICTYMLKFE